MLIREEDKKKLALTTVRERLLAEGDKEGARRQQLGIKRCNERLQSSDEYAIPTPNINSFIWCQVSLGLQVHCNAAGADEDA